jgi:nucleotide-binding universal stress UspA family protein
VKILVTHDGSRASAAVLPAASRIARAMKAEAVLLRVYRLPWQIATNPDEAERERLIADTRARLESELAAEAPRFGEGFAAMVRVLGERWSVPDEILAVAEEVDAELICMATHGESALRHFVAGSVALEVLSKTRRPVVLVRAA